MVSVGFDPKSYTVPEGEFRILTIVKVGMPEESVVVIVNTHDGTATGIQHYNFYTSHNDNNLLAVKDNDYNPLNNVRIVFEPAVFRQTIELFTVSDGVFEGDEDLYASLSVSDTRVDVFDPIANVTITEDDDYNYGI